MEIIGGGNNVPQSVNILGKKSKYMIQILAHYMGCRVTVLESGAILSGIRVTISWNILFTKELETRKIEESKLDAILNGAKISRKVQFMKSIRGEVRQYKEIEESVTMKYIIYK